MHSSDLRSESMNTYSTGYTEFLSKWNWELYLTFYFYEVRKYKPVDLCFAIRKVKAFLWGEKKKTFRQIKFAGIIVAVHRASTHCHVVLVSDNNYPRRLNDLSDKSLSDLQDKWKHGALLIKKVYFNAGICGYLASDRNMDLRLPDSWDLQFFRPRVLTRLNDRTNRIPMAAP